MHCGSMLIVSISRNVGRIWNVMFEIIDRLVISNSILKFNAEICYKFIYF